uniref:CYRIA/CYRIB Rac1 binding domain-containing protein n=2 Tax=Rhizochromulina marina TaxID=1034831 RepID=A0A7S2SQ80_9STRA|mmetsp:Transcript_3984/g.11677  ORF Transcript_3984/g.11677 Transcript_3984/m.11677 type:complete len:134 (+) Transcript_3984:64-465(+)
MDESATGIVSMWIADMMPVTLKVVSALNQALPHEAATTIAEVANCCCGMISGSRTSNTEPYFHAMICAIIIYDRLLLHGGNSVFTSRDVAIRKCLLTIRRSGGSATMQYRNSIQYSTTTFNDAPASIQALCES